MNTRALRRYIDDLLRGRRPKPFRPDDFEAAQIRTAIELQAARRESDAPRPEFLADLHRRLAAQQDSAGRPAPKSNANRRTVIVGTSAAAAAAVAAVSIDRALIDGQVADGGSQELTPNTGRWVRVAASADVTDGVMRPFDVGSVIGFVRRVDGKPEAVSGVCTHQGCRLWFDAPDDRLRCPCHSTSFAPAGQVLTHQLPIAPKPLPTLMVREQDGVIEVFVPAAPHQPA
ncbi:(2Fe-2S)-binding protein [Mycobacterium sp. 1245111.1]|uniref:QcrA and Rieske domain-containing protein n=1 Tax=Mycobacterium sp. 1245111.1 TaxID=1834073 RepID=UPI0007FF5FBA|nr:Rieske (2Fe-2S) protein [Mycobacterium sp. 1245111.1]OBK34342.1 (2Fe-2S)-binding protein [Mycobacterium sp. 1245111.1]